MLHRLLTSLAFQFYKTKWVHHLPKRKPNKPLQKVFQTWTIVRGDFVQIRTGDDRGKVGKVLKVLRKINRVVVRGINMRKYGRMVGQQKKLFHRPKSIHVSNVGLYDSSVKKAVRIRIGYHPQTGKSFRISKKSGRIMRKTTSLKHKRQKRAKNKKIGVKDTPSELVHKVTYQGQDFEAIKAEFQQFILQKQEREKHLVFKQ